MKPKLILLLATAVLGGAIFAHFSRSPATKPVDSPAPLSNRTTARLIHAEDLPMVSREASLMGTEIHVMVVSEDQTTANAAIDAALAEMFRIEELMTDWKDTSQVSAINQNAGRQPVAVDEELLDLLEEAIEISKLTDGKFDITYAGAGRFWDFKSTPAVLPEQKTIEQAIVRIDYRKLHINREKGTAFLAEEGMRIGLGGIAKGYAVDKAAEKIKQAGFQDYAVNAGGDLLIRGRRGEQLWWVGIRDPRSPSRDNVALLPVSNVSVVTSGDYERFIEVDGQRYCHIIDPATGWPVNHMQSVTIVAPKSYWADALATGVFVLGTEKGMALIEGLDGVEGLLIDAEGNLHASTGLQSEQPGESNR